MASRRASLVLGFCLFYTAALLVGTVGAFVASRPRPDFDGQYQKLGTPKVILFLDHANQIPVQNVSRLHGVSLTWVYYDPQEERTDYHLARKLMRIHPNASVQFRTDRRDSELTQLRTDIARLWGPRIEKDRAGATHYIFVTDALYQQDKEWHDHPQTLFAHYLMAWTAFSSGVTLILAALTALFLVLFGGWTGQQPLPVQSARDSDSALAPRRRARLTSRSFLLKRAARRARRRRAL